MTAASRALLSRAAISPLLAVASRRVPLLRPLAAAATLLPAATGTVRGTRCYSTQPATSSLRDSSPSWSNRPPKETILLDGCDFEHWLVVMEPPPGDAANPELTRDEIIDSYIKTLAQVLGSEEEARMKIYSVSTRHYFAFGALVSEELSYKIKELPKVRWVLPDSYLDVKNKDYGGEPFINGEAVPYDPKYHEEWVRNNNRANERSRRNDRPRNFDRSRNFERRRENMQNFQNRDAPPGQGFNSPPPMQHGQGMPPAGQPPMQHGQGMPPAGQPPMQHGQGMPPAGQPPMQHGQGMPPAGQPPMQHGQGMPPDGQPPLQHGQGMPPAGQRPMQHGQGMPPAGQPPMQHGQGMPPAPPPPPSHGAGGPPNYQPQMPNPQAGYNPNANYQQGPPGYQGGNQGYQGNPGPAYPGANPGYGAPGYQGSPYRGGNPNTPYQGGGNPGYSGGAPGYPGQGGNQNYQ